MKKEKSKYLYVPRIQAINGNVDIVRGLTFYGGVQNVFKTDTTSGHNLH